jgi:BMFP domain-containing protein YqiC
LCRHAEGEELFAARDKAAALEKKCRKLEAGGCTS